MHVPQFEPKQGVQIETDPKATNVSSAAALGDDEGVIDSLIKRLEVRCFISRTWPITYQLLTLYTLKSSSLRRAALPL